MGLGQSWSQKLALDSSSSGSFPCPITFPTHFVERKDRGSKADCLLRARARGALRCPSGPGAFVGAAHMGTYIPGEGRMGLVLSLGHIWTSELLPSRSAWRERGPARP